MMRFEVNMAVMTLDELFQTMHRDLEQCFLHHQEALLCFHIRTARDWLKRYRALHDWHLAQEEEKILPLFDKPGLKRQWGRDLYLAEHRKLNVLIAEVDQSLKALEGRDHLQPKDVIEILDEERRLKGLEEHHHHREEQDLLPVVARLPEAQELAVRLHDAWQSLLADWEPMPPKLPSQPVRY